jgi:hypothetical protein
MAEIGRPPGEDEATTFPVGPRQWRRIAVEVAGYLFVAWAVLVAINVYAFTDPAAQTAAGNDLSHVPRIITHIPRNFALLFALLFTLAAAIAPGDAVLRLFRLPYRDWFDRIAFGSAAGLAVLTAVAYALAAVQLLRWQIEAPLLVAGFAASVIAVRRWVKDAPLRPDDVRTPRALLAVFWVLLGASLFVALLAALTPEVGFDARYYHLAEAQRYAQHGGFYNLVAAERMWAYALPHYEETLYAFEWVLFGAIGAKLIAWGVAVSTVLALVAFSRAWFSSTAVGVLAATILFASPVVSWSATTANNDLASVPIVILALHALLCWRASGSRSALCAAGVFAGMTYGIKSFGGFTVVAVGLIALVIILARRTPLKSAAGDLAAYAGCVVFALLPALVTAEWMIGDPLFPFAAGIFASRYGSSHVSLSGISAVYNSRLNPGNLFSLPWVVTVDSLRFKNLVGPIWLTMLPLLLVVPFAVRRRADVIRPLAAFAAIYTAIVVASGAIEFRYGEPVLPAAALVIAYGVLCLDWRAARVLQTVMLTSILVFAALGNGLAAHIERNAGLVMGAPYLNWDYLYEGLPESAVQLQYAPMLEYANANLNPLRDKIYDGVYLQVFNVYSEVPLFNGTSYDGPTGAGEWTLASPDAYARLRAEGCTYVIVSKKAHAALAHAPVWQHLTFVVAKPSINDPKTEDELFKVQ